MTSKKPNPIVEDNLVEEHVPEVIEQPQEPVEVIAQAKTHLAVDGDSYASIAALHKQPGSSTNTYAKTLFALNGGKTITAGVTITL